MKKSRDRSARTRGVKLLCLIAIAADKMVSCSCVS
jgi:hypothetical protein